jgi:transposase
MLKKEPLQLSDRQEKILHKMIKNGRVGTEMCKRLQVLLLAHEGMSNYAINKVIGMHKEWIGIWRNRWEQQWEKIGVLEGDDKFSLSDKDLEKQVLEIMSDKGGQGRRSRITLAQKNQIIAVACEKPEDHGIPVSKWSYDLLARAIVKKKIVDSISPSYVFKILKKNFSHIR